MEINEKSPTFAFGFRKKTAQKQYKQTKDKSKQTLRNKNYMTYLQTKNDKLMKKTLSLLTMLLLSICTAWADETVLSSPNESVITLTDLQGIITITDATDKTGIQVGSNTINGYTPMKLSGSRQFNLTYAENITITKVTLYGTSNDNSKTATLGVSKDDRESLGTLPVKGSDAPLVVDITNVTGLNASAQFLAVIVVEYKLEQVEQDKTFYLNPGAWDVEGATERYAAYVFSGNEDGTWIDLSAVEGDDGIYSVTIPKDYTTFILCRMNGATTENNWDNRWNQSSDLTVSNYPNNSIFTFTNIDGSFTISTYTPPKPLKDYSLSFTTDKAWTDVYAYAWNENDAESSGWPGTKMTLEGDVYTATVQLHNDPTGVLFHNGKEGAEYEQTPDFAYEEGKTYEYKNTTFTATFTTDAGWENVYAYVWSGDGNSATNKLLGEWPGTALTAENNVYTVSIETYNDAPENIQFNNGIAEGTGAAKTHDMGFTNNHAYKWITATPLYALSEGDTFKAGTSVEVKDADGDVVATLTYGVSGGADFNAAGNGWGYNDDYEGFKYMTAGNGENGTATSGTVYTIVPVYDGTISVGVRLNSGKKFYIQEDGTSMTGYDGITMSDLYKGSFDFPVTAGKSYKIYCTGSKLGFYGFDYQFTKPTKTFTATFVNGAGWNPVKAYIWQKVGDEDVELNGGYPGQEISKTGTKTVKGIDYDIYTFTFETTKVSAEPGFIIFSDGTTTNKTEDLEFENEKEYEYGIPTGYSIVTKENDTWTVAATAMDEAEDEGVYSYSATLSGQAGKLFAIAPSTAINGETVNDAALVRPVTEGADWLIEFADYTGTTQNQAGGKVWQIAEANAADVTITFIPATKTFEVTNAIEYTMNDSGFATYSDGKKYKVEGAKANFITVSGNVATLVPQAEGAILPAMTGAGKGCGIIISADAGAKYSIKSVNQSEEAVNSSDNLLAGSGNNSYTISTQFADNDPYTAYIFTKPEGKELGFYIADLNAGADLPAHKAFLAVPKGADAREFIGFEPGETTSIADNNRVTTTNNGDVYNLNGQRVAQPTRGLYIVNGRKVVVK